MGCGGGKIELPESLDVQALGDPSALQVFDDAYIAKPGVNLNLKAELSGDKLELKEDTKTWFTYDTAHGKDMADTRDVLDPSSNKIAFKTKGEAQMRLYSCNPDDGKHEKDLGWGDAGFGTDKNGKRENVCKMSLKSKKGTPVKLTIWPRTGVICMTMDKDNKPICRFKGQDYYSNQNLRSQAANETDWKQFVSKASPCTFEIPPGVDVALVYAAWLLAMANEKNSLLDEDLANSG